jgi:hypothetical protein
MRELFPHEPCPTNTNFRLLNIFSVLLVGYEAGDKRGSLSLSLTVLIEDGSLFEGLSCSSQGREGHLLWHLLSAVRVLAVLPCSWGLVQAVEFPDAVGVEAAAVPKAAAAKPVVLPRRQEVFAEKALVAEMARDMGVETSVGECLVA